MIIYKKIMNTSELMIGDWIFDDKKYAQVTSITHRGGITTTLELNYARVIQPIPITIKLLMAQGFINIQGINNKSGECFIRHSDEHGNTVVRIYYYDGMSYDIVTEIETDLKQMRGTNRIHSCEITYVHELQHALRLCGLSDIADNFKIE